MPVSADSGGVIGRQKSDRVLFSFLCEGFLSKQGAGELVIPIAHNVEPAQNVTSWGSNELTEESRVLMFDFRVVNLTRIASFMISS